MAYEASYEAEAERARLKAEANFRNRFNSDAGKPMRDAIETIQKGNPDLSVQDILNRAVAFGEAVAKISDSTINGDYYTRAERGLALLVAMEPLIFPYMAGLGAAPARQNAGERSFQSLVSPNAPRRLE